MNLAVSLLDLSEQIRRGCTVESNTLEVAEKLGELSFDVGWHPISTPLNPEPKPFLELYVCDGGVVKEGSWDGEVFGNCREGQFVNPTHYMRKYVPDPPEKNDCSPLSPPHVIDAPPPEPSF